MNDQHVEIIHYLWELEFRLFQCGHKFHFLLLGNFL